MATPFANPKRQFRARRDTLPTLIHNIYTFYESESFESESEDIREIDIETFTLEQYLNVNNTRNKKNNLKKTTTSPGHAKNWDELKQNFIRRFFPPAMILKQLGEIRNFKQEDGESLFHTWERYNDLLFKCPFHDLNDHQKVSTFYNGLKGQTRRIVDSNGLILGLTASKALRSIQELDDHSHKWHNEECKNTPSPFSIITEKLKALNHEINDLRIDVRKINTNDGIRSPYEEIKSIRTSEISYDKFSPESNIHSTNLKDTFEHYLKESCKRQDVLNEWMKKFMINTDDETSRIYSSIKRRNNMAGFARNLHVFIGSHQFLIDFIILENINEFMEEGLTEVLFGQPFKEHIGIIDDRVNEILWFKIGDDKTIFNIAVPKKIFGKLTVIQHNIMGPILKISDADRSRGIHHPYQKIKGFYQGCLELGEEYKHDQEVIDWIEGQTTFYQLGGNSRDRLEGILSLFKMEIFPSTYCISYDQKESSREFLALILLFSIYSFPLIMGIDLYEGHSSLSPNHSEHTSIVAVSGSIPYEATTYPFEYRVTLGFGSIAGGLDHVSPVIRLPIERGINSGTRIGLNLIPSVGTNPVTASIT
ncbi:homeodomain-like protein [Tanacetum coccineum]